MSVIDNIMKAEIQEMIDGSITKALAELPPIPKKEDERAVVDASISNVLAELPGMIDAGIKAHLASHGLAEVKPAPEVKSTE